MKDFDAAAVNKMNLPFMHRVDMVNNTRVIRLKGKFDHHTLPKILKLVADVDEEYEANSSNMLLDFADVEDIDTSAL